jgi:hypothetical protein
VQSAHALVSAQKFVESEAQRDANDF